MFVPASGTVMAGLPVFLAVGLIAAGWAMFGPNAFDADERWQFKTRHAFAVAAALGACLALMAGSGSSPFLYFQF
jgi:hypothetical protein